MKVFLGLAFVALGCWNYVFGLEKASSGLALVRLQRSIHDFANGLPAFRRKRQTSCVNRCLEPLASEVAGLDTTSGSLNPEIFFNEERLASFCSAAGISSTCMEECSDGTLKYFMTLALDMFDGICVDNREEFESYIPCYQRSQAQIESNCTPECGGKDELQRLLLRQKIAKALGDINGLSRIMGELCTMVSCRKSCEAEVITEECGDSAPADLLKAFGVSQYKQMKEKFESDKIQRYWPEECTDVIDEFLPEEEESAEDKDDF